jgi:hypothetical protein
MRGLAEYDDERLVLEVRDAANRAAAQDGQLF